MTVEVNVVDAVVVAVDVCVVEVMTVDVADVVFVVVSVDVMEEVAEEVAEDVPVVPNVELAVEERDEVAVEVNVDDCEFERVLVAVVDKDEVAVLETDVVAEDVAVVVTVVFLQVEYAPDEWSSTASFKTNVILLHMSAPRTTNNLVNLSQLILSL